MPLTYRKLAFLLLFLATALLAVAWLGSLRTWRECTVIAQPCTFHFSLRSGTAGGYVATRGASGYGVRSSSYQPEPSQLAANGTMGRLRLERIPLPLPGSAGHHGYRLEMPVWLPYLLFVAGMVVWLKVRGGQMDAATEKTLAIRAETDRRTGNDN